MKHLIFAALILMSGSLLYGQDNKTLAMEKARKAVEIMDNVSVEEAITLLEEAKKLDPGTYVYDYEIGYAYTVKQDYPKALEIFRKVVKYKDANDQCYQMLGNLYDYNGDPENAIKTYDRGLKKFPNSGRLYLEKGIICNMQKRYAQALALYEAGIRAEPSYPSNYYRAAQILCNSDEEVWGMIYGEIFINLEPNTQRSQDISKLLFDTYKSEIKFTSDTTVTVSFCKNTVINITIDDLKKPDQFKLPFGSMIYETTLLLSVVNEKNIDLSSLDRIRENFVINYFGNKHEVKYPNVLFDYQKKILDSENMEAYNYWLLSSGDLNSFNLWKEHNAGKWEKFVEWFDNNRLILSQDYVFSRDQY